MSKLVLCAGRSLAMHAGFAEARTEANKTNKVKKRSCWSDEELVPRYKFDQLPLERSAPVSAELCLCIPHGFFSCDLNSHFLYLYWYIYMQIYNFPNNIVRNLLQLWPEQDKNASLSKLITKRDKRQFVSQL